MREIGGNGAPALCERMGPTQGVAVACQNLGNIQLRRGELATARGYFERSAAAGAAMDASRPWWGPKRAWPRSSCCRISLSRRSSAASPRWPWASSFLLGEVPTGTLPVGAARSASGARRARR